MTKSRKRTIIDALEQLPETATLDDIEDRFWFVMKIERRLADANAGNLVPHEELVAYFKEKYGVDVEHGLEAELEAGD